jgi:hypothetical protein
MISSNEVKIRVCLSCPDRNGTQDDPDYTMSFCRQWLPACPYFKNRAVATFCIEDTGETIYIPEFDVSIPKTMIDSYINHIIDRLRGRIIHDYERDNLLLRVEELEDIRRDLHQKIKRCIWSDPFAVDTITITIEHLVEQYIEDRVKRFA